MKIHKRIELESNDELLMLFGPGDKFLRKIRQIFDVKIITRNNHILITGRKQNADEAFDITMDMLRAIRQKGVLTAGDTEHIIDKYLHARVKSTEPCHTTAEATVRKPDFEARSKGQQEYLDDLTHYAIVFSIGPAGTGKTYLAVANAVGALKDGKVRRIVLARPAVEAGERLGYLPGDYQAKVNPYLRPLYDALNSFLEMGQLKSLIDNEVIEIVPLAYMRGRTLDNAFIILDEAQNTTSEQMKMFLTRMGNNSRIVITGDITQTDLPPGKVSGLVEVQSLLGQIEGVKFTYLKKEDIVRHPLVQEIVDAYEHKRKR